MARDSLKRYSLNGYHFLVGNRVWVIFSFILIFWINYFINLITDDSYFYLVVSRNIVQTGFQTFNNIFITNGVHPLWLYCLVIFDFISHIISPKLLNREWHLLPLSALFLFIGTYNLVELKKLLKVRYNLMIYFPLLFVSLFGVLYSEAHVVYAALTWFSVMVKRIEISRVYQPITIGVVSLVVFLSRLDMIFILISFYIWLLYRSKSYKVCLKAGGFFILIALPYLLSNYYFFGSLTPISGFLKSTFPIVSDKPFLSGAYRDIKQYNVLFGYFPIVLSGVILSLRRISIKSHGLYYIFLVGTILHCLYCVLFTWGYTFWYWYYIPNVILLGLTMNLLIDKKVYKLIGYTFVCGMFFWVGTHQINKDKSDYIDRKVVAFLNKYKIQDSTILISDYPGYVAYHSPENRFIAADMLTSNKYIYRKLTHPDGDAFVTLQELIQKKGHGMLDYIVYTGNIFIKYNNRFDRGYFINPKDPHRNMREIGEMYIGKPFYQKNGLIIHKI